MQKRPPSPSPCRPRARLRLDEPQGETIAAVSSLIVHVGGEAAHQMDADLADLGVLERRCPYRRRRLGWIELPAVVLDQGHQGAVIALDLDRDLQWIAFGAAVHDDVGNRLLQAQLHRKGYLRR